MASDLRRPPGGAGPAAWPARWEQVLTRAQAPGAGVLVVEDGGSLLGLASYFPSRDDAAEAARTGEIGAIYLLPDAWAKEPASS